MPRSEETNQRIRGERRQQILAAAARKFARRGFAATGITDIAAEATMSYGLVYHYFPNKDEVFAALTEDGVQNTARLVQVALERPGTAWDRLNWMIAQILQGVYEHPETFMIYFQALATEAMPQAVHELAQKQGEMSWSALRQLIVESQEEGRIVAGDPDQLTTILASCINGLALGAIFLDHVMVGFPDADHLLEIFQADTENLIDMRKERDAPFPPE